MAGVRTSLNLFHTIDLFNWDVLMELLSIGVAIYSRFGVRHSVLRTPE